MEQALWFTSRATGLVTLPLLTLSVVLGVIGAARFATPRWPRFTLAALHRNVALLTLLFLAVHVASAVIDPYAKIGWLDTVLPFVSVYQPFWLGLGAIAMDLLLATAVTSMARSRISPRTWRAVHWAGYVCWPVAVVHGLGIGGADSSLSWVIALNVLCAAAVLAALVWRLRRQPHPDLTARRSATVGGR
ncbi:MAG: ferric reductase-like transmembrane domain-containing protein [Pseudonocardia sp.]